MTEQVAPVILAARVRDSTCRRKNRSSLDQGLQKQQKRLLSFVFSQ
jgi:hypothetical protein